MTAHEDSQVDPQHDAASLGGAPESDEESARARDLAELFGPLVEDDEPLADVDDTASREHLAALFAGQSAAIATTAGVEPDFSWQPEPAVPAEPSSAWAREPMTSAEPSVAERGEPVVAAEPASAWAREPDVGAEPASAWAREPGVAVEPEAASDAALTREVSEPAVTERKPRAEDAETAVIAGGAVAASALPFVARGREAPVESSEADASSEDSLAWLDRVSENPTDTPEKAALGSWLGTLNGGSETTALPAAVAAAATTDHTQVLPEAPAGSSTGSFFPAQRRGIRGWSSRVRWSVAVSIVLGEAGEDQYGVFLKDYKPSPW
ncbi:MAG: hypothetical protein ABWX68_03555 [Arthrobacter sp.]